MRNIPAELVTRYARQKWPEIVLEVDDFPRTASGKVPKRLVRSGIAVASG
jgi:acyl-CoA synthetase